MVTKEELRQVYLEKRLFLSDEEYEIRNKGIRKNFQSFISGLQLESIHIFLPITEKREVNTWPLIHDLRGQSPETRIYTSKVVKGGKLQHFLLNEDTRLVVNRWGIPEPEDEPPVELTNIDAVVIPLIISDKSGNRIGYGKGYYDRFLANTHATHRIGVTLSPPLDVIPVAESHDIALTCCIGPHFIDKFYL
jgi:5-formyltetrahydrofolate cyclo-ligase